jgi:GNAT superfamily N-acetyltransferase
MNVVYAELTDFDAWIALAREVEHLFGPMADEAPFQDALRQAISQKTAFCIRADLDGEECALKGGIVISEESNEIAWLAVSDRYRRKGYGGALLKFAMSRLNHYEDIFVQTFAESCFEGKAARKLYFNSGFMDNKDSGLNPAGIPTVIMKLAKTN